MGKLSTHMAGASFALAAAALNASIGVISKILLKIGISASSIALTKTVLGLVILSLFLLFLRKSKTRISMWQAAVCAFFGIFTLFFFETAAYQHESAANVVVTLMAFASLSALLFSWMILGDRPGIPQWIGFSLAILGVSLIVGVKLDINIQGILLSAIAGSGYGLFSVLVKKMKLDGGLILTRLLLFFGSLFLLLPAFKNGLEPELLSVNAIGALLALAILPTILGFFCTTKAIQILPPAQVQILELSEPLFAACLALLILNEVPGVETYSGGALIIIGLAISNEVIKFGAIGPKNLKRADA